MGFITHRQREAILIRADYERCADHRRGSRRRSSDQLNPVEPVWSHLKRSLANLVKQDINQLTALVRTRLRRMQYRPGLLEGFLAKTRLDLTPLR